MTLENKKVVILVDNDYQDLEVWYPYYRLLEEGAEVVFAVPDMEDDYVGKHGYPLDGDVSFEALNAAEYDVVIIPGGWAPDSLRKDERVLEFVRQMNTSGKVVAAICHAGWVLASAGLLQGKTVTCYDAIKADIINAGANYVDQEVAVDGNLITSRDPDDLPEFCLAIIDKFEENGVVDSPVESSEVGGTQTAL